MRVLSMITATCLIVLAGSWASGQTVRGNPKAGQAIYEQHCLRCHGEKMDGNGPDTPYLIVRPANLQSLITRSRGIPGTLHADSHSSADATLGILWVSWSL